MNILRRGHAGELLAFDLQSLADRRIQATGDCRDDARRNKQRRESS